MNDQRHALRMHTSGWRISPSLIRNDQQEKALKISRLSKSNGRSNRIVNFLEPLENRLCMSGDTSVVTLFGNTGNITAGQAIAFTLDVGVPIGSSYGVSPTGTVDLLANGNVIGSGAVPSGGIVTLTSSDLPVGVDTITAFYPGDDNFLADTSDADTVVVNGAPTNTAVTTFSPPPELIDQGDTLSLTASVAPAVAGGPTPTGTVQFHFKADGNWRDYSESLVNGSCTFTNTDLPANYYDVTASYDGDSTYGLSPSLTYPLDVNTSGITASIAKSTVAPTLLQGHKTTARVTVTLKNTLSTDVKTFETVAVNALENGELQLDGQEVGSASREVSLHPGQSVQIPITTSVLLSDLADGQYTLDASVVDSNGNVSYSAPGASVTVAQPFVSLVATSLTTNLKAPVVSTLKTPGRATLLLTNDGNIPTKGKTRITLYATPDGTIASGTFISSYFTGAIIQPGRHTTLNIPLKAIPPITNGIYQIAAQITDPLNDLTTGVTAQSYTIAAPFTSLVPSIAGTYMLSGPTAAFSKVSVSIANAANVPFRGKVTIAVHTSTDGTLANATLVTGEMINLVVSLTRLTVVPVRLTKTEAAAASAGTFLIVTVTDPLNVVTMAVV
jgi:hypothetical protein